MRRAWIEIDVDPEKYIQDGRSPSMRRAWIEMARFGLTSSSPVPVALHAEGVDRNKEWNESPDGKGSRPPCGGRG